MTFRQLLPNGDVPDGCLIVGEVSQSHDGSLGTAHAFIDAIADAGADAVKFQTHIASEESTPDEPWRVKFSRQDETRYDYWRRMEFTPAQWAGLKEHCDERGVLFLSSAFSSRAVAMLSDLDMQAWKVASGEVTNLPLLDEMAATGRPVILSSGMSTWAELDIAVERVRTTGAPVAVLQCATAYPSPPERTGLNLLSDLRDRYGCPVGISDHSATIYASLAAVTLGASIVEVHVALSREMFGPDVAASITTPELRQLVDGVRFIEAALANPVDKDEAAEVTRPLRDIFTRSVVAKRPIEAGTILTEDMLVAKKPGTGIPAQDLPSLIGRRVVRPLAADQLLDHHDLESP